MTDGGRSTVGSMVFSASDEIQSYLTLNGGAESKSDLVDMFSDLVERKQVCKYQSVFMFLVIFVF